MCTPGTTSELEAAVDGSQLPSESAYYEYKRELPHRSKNGDIAVDVAAVTTDGGVIIYADANRLWAHLTVHGKVVDDAAVRFWLDDKGLGWAKPLVTALNKGAHGEALGDLDEMRRDTRKLGEALRTVIV